MRWRRQNREFSNSVYNVFGDNSIVTSMFPDDLLLSKTKICRNVTFLVTEECNCACTYCYLGHKTYKYMTLDVAKKIVDYLFSEWLRDDENAVINKSVVGIILDFIGGEPLLNIDIINYTCEYFYNRCLVENHPWKDVWSASISTNGALYFKPEVQAFLNKFKNHVSISVSVDGPKEIHDACRVYKDGSGGNFEDAYKALLAIKKNNPEPGTKVTISADNLPYLNTIVDFFISNLITDIHGNVVFEHLWTIEESKVFYKLLKILADSMLRYDGDIYVSFFEDSGFLPMSNEDNNNWCGGTGGMLCFDPDGTAYPCLRYTSTSLGNDLPPIIIGNASDGIYNTDETIKIKEFLDSITRRSQSTDECFNCPIARGCAWCSGWNYLETGTVNCRSTRICNSHKARSLANVYFWNRYYVQESIPKYFHRYLSDEEALKFISKEELDMLDNLEAVAYEKSTKEPLIEYPDVIINKEIKLISK